jgi:hypothetical protein
MPITINGSGTVTGISAGGLPDDCIVTADIADANVTAAKLSGAQTGSAPIYGCRAWVNFDGTRNEADTGASTNGANVKIRGSGNVSSVLKNGTGDYTVNFTTAMVDANYSTVVGGNAMSNGSSVAMPSLYQYNTSTSGSTATNVRVNGVATGGGGVAADLPYFNVAIFR